MAPMVKEPIRTFSVGFAEGEANELAYARLAARAVGAEHREVVVSPERVLPARCRGSCGTRTSRSRSPRACRSTSSRGWPREHVKVVLTGEGADELFLGYNRYRVTAWNERLGGRYGALAPAALRGGGAPRAGRAARAGRALCARAASSRTRRGRGRSSSRTSRCSRPRCSATCSPTPALLDARDPYAAGCAATTRRRAVPLERMSHADLQTYLVELLMKQDQMSMAASIESRVPFLDHGLVERVAALPGALKLRGWQTKAVLREAVADSCRRPSSRGRKMGFPVPLGPLAARAVLRRWSTSSCWARARAPAGSSTRAALRRLAAEHRAGAAEPRRRLWLLVNLEIWHRVFIDGDEPAPVAA